MSPVSVTLHLVRHAEAVGAADARGADEARALTARGNAQARHLARSLTRTRARLQRLCTSPKLRAMQTAEALRAEGGPAESAPLVVLDELAAGSAAATVRALAAELGSFESRLAAVGHEPYLSELASYLLTGGEHGLRIGLGTASVLVLEGPLRAGSMTLRSYLPIEHVEELTQVGAAGERP